MLVLRLEDRIAGMLTMLPVALLAGGKALKARYVFAIATKESYRNRGVSTQLLAAANAAAAAEGCAATLLVPANERLFVFYGKRAYETTFYTDVLTFEAAALAAAPVAGAFSPCGVDEWSRMRDAAFGGSSLYARWDRDALSYIIWSVEAGGGGVLCLNGISGSAAAVCERREDTLRITELAGRMDPREAAALAIRRFPAARCELRLRQGEARGARTVPFGMVRWLTAPPKIQGAPNYLALAKD